MGRRDMKRAKRKTEYEQFSSKVEKLPAGCWMWTGSAVENKRTGLRYGQVKVDGRLIMATHLSLKIFKGIEIEQGQVTMHSCDNSLCVNPDHLSKGTQADNVQDAIKKGRFFYNLQNLIFTSKKLTDEQADMICNEYKERKTPQRVLAKRYKVSQATIRRILMNEKTEVNQ